MGNTISRARLPFAPDKFKILKKKAGFREKKTTEDKVLLMKTVL